MLKSNFFAVSFWLSAGQLKHLNFRLSSTCFGCLRKTGNHYFKPWSGSCTLCSQHWAMCKKTGKYTNIRKRKIKLIIVEKSEIGKEREICEGFFNRRFVCYMCDVLFRMLNFFSSLICMIKRLQAAGGIYMYLAWNICSWQKFVIQTDRNKSSMQIYAFASGQEKKNPVPQAQRFQEAVGTISFFTFFFAKITQKKLKNHDFFSCSLR